MNGYSIEYSKPRSRQATARRGDLVENSVRHIPQSDASHKEQERPV
jgi:hypothetical protein